MRMVLADGSASGDVPDRALLKQLVVARRWWSELRQGHIDITRLSEREGVTAPYITRIVRLAFLSPQVVDAALAGRMKSGVDTAMLRGHTAVLASWAAQRTMLVAGC